LAEIQPATLTSVFVWDSKFFSVIGRVFVIGALILVPASLAMGEPWRALLMFLAAFFWAGFARYWSNVAARKARHSELRAKRLAREKNQSAS
jgi:hypothetical protein